MKKIFTGFFCIMVALGLCTPLRIEANATIRMPNTAYVGDVVNVTVTVPSNSKSWAYSISGAVSGDVMAFEGDSRSSSFSFKASAVGSYTVTIYGQYSDGNTDYSISNSATVNVVNRPSNSNSNTNSNSNANTNTNSKPSNNVSQGPKVEPQEDPRSKDNNLKSLSVSAGTLSPKFSANTTSYKVNLPADATSIEIKASANDSKAKVSGVGTKKVQAGENKINIVVTSEYGTTKTYTITVNVDEKPLIYTDYNGNKLGVVRNIRGVNAPEGFKQTKVKLDGKEIPAWTNEKMNKTLIYLSDEKNEKSFYLYEEGKVTTKMTYKEIMGRKFFLVDIPKDKQSRKGMEYKEISIDKTKLMGWTYTDKAFANYSLLYVMGMDGEMHYYQYEKSENILQLYSGAVPLTQEAYDKERKDLESSKNTWMMVGILTIITTVVSAGAALYLFKKSK